MTRKIVRFAVLGLAGGLMLAAVAGCFFGGGEEAEPTPTPDLQATIKAAVGESLPTDTPAPEPPTETPTPEPPTATPTPEPDLQATLQAMMAATIAAAPTDTPTPPPTDTPTPPPTDTPTPPPTDTPTPTPTPTPVTEPFSSTQPCFIVGEVTIGGNPASEGVSVSARQQDDAEIVEQAQIDENGRYKLEIVDFGKVFDLYVDGEDSGKDTPRTERGCRRVIDLDIS